MKKLTEYVSKGKFYESVVEDGSDIIFIVDFKGQILYHNDAAEEVLGHKPKSLINQNMFDFIKPDTHPVFDKKFAESIRKPYNDSIEFQFRCKDGSYKYLEFNSINLKPKEGLEGLILDCRDISERKHSSEELLRAQKAKEQFLANISHEIRTPINGIAGMAELLSQSPTAEESHTYLNAIKTAAANLKVIINDILDLSSIESGKLKFEKIGFNLKDLLSSLLDTFQVQAREKGIQLQLEIDEQANTILLGDPVRLNQVLINLLGNAIKFTHDGYIRVHCLVEKKHRRKYDMRFDVIDTGIGIPTDKLETIFESFSQADESVTRKYGGTGLGLTIVKQLVELQGGRITVDSKEDEGSVFSVHIPYAIGGSEDIAGSNRNHIITAHRDALKNMNILLVEDNDINRLYANSILKTWECKIDMAENGYVAVEKIKDNQFDIVLMDIQMPVMDGFEATKAIRLGDHQNGIPLIALTANATRKDIEKCLAAGMNDCIPKPFTPEDLFRMLFKYSTFIKMNKQPVVQKAVVEEKTSPMPAPEPVAHNGTETIDLSYLKKVTSNNDAFLKDMIVTFLETMPKSINEIRTSINAKDWESLARAVHKIKPSLAMMGLNKTRDVGAMIEMSSKDRTDLQKLPEITQGFCVQLESALEQLKKL
ncbi:MAG TPA: ATP-binding protein [Cyclobacteriaceae bacterium]|nr:ATP-binding protein [Cyclobacteriaceae bacterium]